MDEKIIKAYYEENPEGLPGNEKFPEIQEMHNLFTHFIVKTKPNKLLEAGCGKGYLGAELSKHCGTYYGLDISSSAISIAKYKIKKGIFQEGSIKMLPYPDNFFDCVVCSEVLEHVPQYTSAICELSRVAKPGASIIISTPNAINPDMVFKTFTKGKYTNQIYDRPIKYKELIRVFSSEGLILKDFQSFYYLPLLGEYLPKKLLPILFKIQKLISLKIGIPLGLYLFFLLQKTSLK